MASWKHEHIELSVCKSAISIQLCLHKPGHEHVVLLTGEWGSHSKISARPAQNDMNTKNIQNATNEKTNEHMSFLANEQHKERENTLNKIIVRVMDLSCQVATEKAMFQGMGGDAARLGFRFGLDLPSHPKAPSSQNQRVTVGCGVWCENA